MCPVADIGLLINSSVEIGLHVEENLSRKHSCSRGYTLHKTAFLHFSSAEVLRKVGDLELIEWPFPQTVFVLYLQFSSSIRTTSVPFVDVIGSTLTPPT